MQSLLHSAGRKTLVDAGLLPYAVTAPISYTGTAALLRRRIRDPQLTLEGHKVSDCSRADVVLCYLENKVDRKLLDEVRQKLAKIDVRSVSMSQESIVEAMMGKKQWLQK